MSEYRKSEEAFAKYFRDSSDSIDMNVNGSVTPVNFDINGEATGPVEIYHIVLAITDASITTTAFGGIVGGITNGITMKFFDSNGVVLFDPFDGASVKNNRGFLAPSGGETLAEPASGDDFLIIPFDFAAEGGAILLDPTDYIRITISDDITGLSFFRAMAHGMKR